MSATGRRGGFSPLIAGFIAGIALAILLVLLTKINLDLAAPWTHTHTLVAQVSDVDGISISSDVRIAGRTVGQVTDVQSKGSYSLVTFHVDDADWPLPADTSASIRLATLLGQKYVQLAPGHASQAIADGALIGPQATKPVVDFDQILNTFDKPTRDSLTSLIRTAAGAVQGQEGTIQQLLPGLGNLSIHSQVPTQELVSRNGELNSILINLGTTAAQLNASRTDLAGVISNLNSVTAALASNQGRALTGFISRTDTLNQTTSAVLGGGSAAALDSGLRRLSTFAGYMNGLLTTLIPQTRSFNQPVRGAEPSDQVNGNNLIPARSAVDLIYEIGNATSQGYGSHNFGTAGMPNFQGSFFLRQNLQGYDTCGFVQPPLVPCVWGQTGPPAPHNAVSAPAVPLPSASAGPTPSPSATPSPCPSPSSSPSPSPSASASPGATPSSCPGPSPSPSPSPTPSASPSPSSSPTASPAPTPSPSPSSSLASMADYAAGPPAAETAPISAGASLWDALFPWSEGW